MNTQNTAKFDPYLFALDRREKEFGPDDTAWQFLRWNPDYREAFHRLRGEKHDADALEAILSHMQDPNPDVLVCAQDETCRRRFGIAAWLDPDEERLPELKNPGDSWFFPLMRPLQEDTMLKFWQREASYGTRPGGPWVTVRETPFGYRDVLRTGPRRPARSPAQKENHQERLVFTAIDCSVPIDAQLMALEKLVRTHREYWNQQIRTTDTPHVVIEPVGWNDVIRQSRTEDADFWRTVGIDALGPIRKQIEECRSSLSRIHQRLHDDDAVLRFGERFPMPKAPGGEGAAHSRNRYLKALLMIAERIPPDAFKTDDIDAERPGLAHEIAKELGIVHANRPPWMRIFDEGMSTWHLRRAKSLVTHFYAWLVHAQISFADEAKKEKEEASASNAAAATARTLIAAR
ncbi:transcriptional regulator domain-containing protein [Burkholderia pseudomallei]|uniref:transcriptional regulator domain-containing protein n=1 Tax=Burkholderia pseudomallei TaxID=28450 RepID=UPI000F04E1DF|nr:hypothetical protein [Burkholderia pseudomallei]CAJ4818305.1 Uncharacterised protein [Burkholderia pseudomallei]CAJ9365511.1 Uncharacterised protein [Burkholderia pseudomallei]VBB90226.1 Uncharacterised protein [Burkholderia pseudomallei]VBD73743.1 Uncharacterised protein [Burkholderia pseudomallei]VBE22850.1 Uncharacterised protein [Burkholderia pseudomallei]